MAKKRVTVYMREDDFEWLSQYPIAESASGSATLLTEWAVKLARLGALTAFGKLNEEEKMLVTEYASSLSVTPDYSPQVLSSSIEVWAYSSVHSQDKDTISALAEKCKNMTPAEVMGLLSWAKGYWIIERVDRDIEKYLNSMRI